MGTALDHEERCRHHYEPGMQRKIQKHATIGKMAKAVTEAVDLLVKQRPKYHEDHKNGEKGWKD